MLRIYLPSSTDLKLCSDVIIVDFVDTWTFVTEFMSRHLGLNIWVLANGSKIICQPLGHLLGPRSQVLTQAHKWPPIATRDRTYLSIVRTDPTFWPIFVRTYLPTPTYLLGILNISFIEKLPKIIIF